MKERRGELSLSEWTAPEGELKPYNACHIALKP